MSISSTWWGGNNYSTEEQVIGTWIDGKPIYQKTINFGVLPNNATKTIPHGISNIEFVIGCGGFAKRSGAYIPIPRIGVNVCGIDADDTNIQIITNANYSTYTTSYVTIQYTKTTD